MPNDDSNNSDTRGVSSPSQSAEMPNSDSVQSLATVPGQPQLYNDQETVQGSLDSAQNVVQENGPQNNESAGVVTENVDEEPDNTFSWNAPEFVHHQKNFEWYSLFFLACLLLAGLIYFLTKSIVSISVVIVGALLLAYYSAKKPQEITYSMNNRGITVGQRFFEYENFKSFSVIQEGTARNIVFMPQKRFALMLSIYYHAENEEMIIGLLSTVLPLTEFSHDAVDRLMHNIRF
jgi:hypothetical protein